MWTDLLVILACFVVLDLGANYLVEGLGAISQRFKISEAVLGASIAAMGSSAPEFGSSTFSVVLGEPTIGLGTIIGSAIFNVTVIIGAAALFGKYKFESRVFYRDGLFYLFTVGVTILAVIDGKLTSFEAISWVVIFFAYLGWLIHDARRGKPVPKESFKPMSSRRAVVLIILSLLVIGVSARFLVSSVISITSKVGVSKTIFSLVIVAVGTSIPDLLTSLQAARKKMGSLAVSNALGSNVFDVLICLGLPLSFIPKPEAIVGPMFVSVLFLLLSLVVALFVIRWKWSVTRKEAALLFGTYGAYLTILLLI